MKTFSTPTLLAGLLTWAVAVPTTETPAQRDQRMAWWREARLGMFIHFYTTTANPVGAVPWGRITTRNP